MKEYKVVLTREPSDAEVEMNRRAMDGWRVVSVNKWGLPPPQIMITFEREKER